MSVHVTVQLDQKPKDFIAAHANATPASLLDEIKTLRDVEKIGKRDSKLLQTMLYARVDPPIDGDAEDKSQYHGRTFTGDNTSAKIIWVQQSRFDTESFAADYPELYKKYVKTIEFLTLKFDKE